MQANTFCFFLFFLTKLHLFFNERGFNEPGTFGVPKGITSLIWLIFFVITGKVSNSFRNWPRIHFSMYCISTRKKEIFRRSYRVKPNRYSQRCGDIDSHTETWQWLRHTKCPSPLFELHDKIKISYYALSYFPGNKFNFNLRHCRNNLRSYASSTL